MGNGSLLSNNSKRFKQTPGQTLANRNSNILNFFQKSHHQPKSTQSRITEFGIKIDRLQRAGNQDSLWEKGTLKEDQNIGSLFVEDREGILGSTIEGQHASWSAKGSTKECLHSPVAGTWEVMDEGLEAGNAQVARLDVDGVTIKRRRLYNPSLITGEPNTTNERPGIAPPKISRQPIGPFIDESDESDEEDKLGVLKELCGSNSEVQQNVTIKGSTDVGCCHSQLARVITRDCCNDQGATIGNLASNLEGGEFVDPPRTLEDALELGNHEKIDHPPDFGGILAGHLDARTACPICETSLSGLSDHEMTLHVNGCLDEDHSPLQMKTRFSIPEANPERACSTRIVKPGQGNPFTIDGVKTTSAFSRLMAGNAEHTAWNVAADNEIRSYRKHANDRTCPFYKILPGFSICVDAFRYGAVEGCSAYFLSHFHSDHYSGLTPSWSYGPIYCSKVTGALVQQQLKVDPRWVVSLEFEEKTKVPDTNGVHVTMISANHCPGSSLFLFEKSTGHGPSARVQRVLHCGDFRASLFHVRHPLLRAETVDETTSQVKEQKIDVCYLDTTYLHPKYAFPRQEDVIKACADICVQMNGGHDSISQMVHYDNGERGCNVISKFFSNHPENVKSRRTGPISQERLLVVIGTYSIGKERICIGIAQALKCKIYAFPAKRHVCACLEDPELSSLLTDDPREAQVHMQILSEIRAETLKEYLDSLKPHFTRVVGFRPTGWTYRPPGGRVLSNPSVSDVLHSDNWKTPFSVHDLVLQRGSTRESSCFGVPYSEHSSFRELTMFCCALHISRVIPTVNIGSQTSREKMKQWFERWERQKRKFGLLQIEDCHW